MQTTISIHPVGAGFGYSVCSDGGHALRQDYAPGQSGRKEMTAAEALAYARADADALEATAAAPEPTPLEPT